MGDSQSLTYSGREEAYTAGVFFFDILSTILSMGAGAYLKSMKAGSTGAKTAGNAARAADKVEDIVTNKSLDEVAGSEFLDNRIRTVDQPLLPEMRIESSVEGFLWGRYEAVTEVAVIVNRPDILKSLNTYSPGDWVKVYEAASLNGNLFEIHYFRNNTTGQVFDVKLKTDKLRQKEFKNIK